jgi:hypothetical protein
MTSLRPIYSGTASAVENNFFAKQSHLVAGSGAGHQATIRGWQIAQQPVELVP